MKVLHHTHEPGRHCASTGMRDLLAYHEVNMSEAMCFGIGQGMGIYYIEAEPPLPSRIVHLRSADFERQFFTMIGYAFQWETHHDPHKSEAVLIERLNENRAAIIQTDIYHLPYFNTNTHFPGHVINVWGYDPEAFCFFVTDTERDDLIKVPMVDMRKARYSRGGFYEILGNMFAPESIAIKNEIATIIRDAILLNSRSLVEDRFDFSGKGALEKWERDIRSWETLDDWKWTARFAYQVIEKRGTGGGGFRYIYRDFLKESKDLVPQIRKYGLDERMEHVADGWRNLSYALKDASEQDVADFSEAKDKLTQLITLELSYHDDVIHMFA